MSTNSKRGAYFVPTEHKKWWHNLTNIQFMRFLRIASARTGEIHSQPPPEPVIMAVSNHHCHKCNGDLANNTLILTCDKCGVWIK